MKIFLILVLSSYFISSGLSQDAYSVKSQTKGFALASYFGKLAWTSEDLNAQNENGFYYGFQGGYGINHQWALTAQVQFASINSPFEGYENYPYFELDLGGRYYFLSNTQSWRPYLGAHLNYSKHREGYPSANDPDITINLRMLALGVGLSGGVQYFVNRHLSILGFGQACFGKSTKAYIDGVVTDENFDFSAFKFGFGLAYNFKN